MTFRSAKTIKRYRNRQKLVTGFDKQTCPFCKIDKKFTTVISESKYFYVLNNAFPYDIWDGQRVSEHLMITPKRHICSITEFTPNEMREFHNLLSKYEASDYSVYFRHKDNVMKSVDYQHTHLIKFDNKKLKFNLYLKNHIYCGGDNHGV